MDNNILKGKKVLIFQQRGWGRGVGRFLSRKFNEEGCKLAALTSTAKTFDLIQRQEFEEGIKYEMLINHDEIFGNPKKYLGDDDFSLDEICDDLGIDSVWLFVWSLRIYVRSYEDKYYYGFKQNLSDEDIIIYIKALYKCAKNCFEIFKPDIIVAPNFVSIHHIFFNILIEKSGGKMIVLTDSKIKGMFIFTHDYNDSTGSFYERIKKLNNGEEYSKNLEKAKKYIEEVRNASCKSNEIIFKTKKYSIFVLLKKIKSEIAPFVHILRWYRNKITNRTLSDYPTSLGVNPGYRPPKIILRDHFAHRKYTKFANNFKYYTFDKVGKFVFFPLQVQPETVIDVTSPLFSNQIETARQLAMSLPGDYTLVVKDHPQMLGLRTDSYITKLSRTVNVKLIDYRTPVNIIFKKMDLLISPGGTSVAEAAFFNKPAIQLGNLGTTSNMPNFLKHSDMSTISKVIKEMLLKKLDTDDYEKKLENYVSAVYDTGTDVNYINIWEGRDTSNMDDLWKAYKIEIERILKNK
jgi:hypothetical protein